MKTIKFYTLNQWGVRREFVHSDNLGDRQIISQLTGKKTIDSVTRELIRDLSGGQIQWQEVIASKNGILLTD